MNEHSITFKGEMIAAILSGAKTQTRRPMNPQPEPQYNFTEVFRDGTCEVGISIDAPNHYQISHGRGGVGDRLWVQEVYAENPEVPGQFIYRADRGGDFQGAAQGLFKWKSPRYMPRAASRITLEILDLRVERLHSITESDAVAEGMEKWTRKGQGSACTRFAILWEKIYGRRTWRKNPWVWVIKFKRITPSSP